MYWPAVVHFPQHFGVPQYLWSSLSMNNLILLYMFFIYTLVALSLFDYTMYIFSHILC